jgi:hypothetical protein
VKLCPTCGFGLWQYNHDTLTCKHGHQWTEDTLKTAPALTLVEAKPVAPWTPIRPKRSPLPLAACFVAGAVLDLLAHLVIG